MGAPCSKQHANLECCYRTGQDSRAQLLSKDRRSSRLDVESVVDRNGLASKIDAPLKIIKEEADVLATLDVLGGADHSFTAIPPKLDVELRASGVGQDPFEKDSAPDDTDAPLMQHTSTAEAVEAKRVSIAASRNCHTFIAAGNRFDAVGSLHRLLNQGAVNHTRAMLKEMFQTCFTSWRELLQKKKLRKLEKNEKIVAKIVNGSIAKIFGELRDLCFKKWHDIVVEDSGSKRGYLRVRAPFKLARGDHIMVDSERDKVKALCEGDYRHWSGGWTFEKNYYVGHCGVVIGKDWLGSGIRVKFDDGHWWSFAPEALHVKTKSLTESRRKLLAHQRDADSGK